MVSYLPEIRAGMALLLAFCAMVQDLRNFKIGNRQILVGLLGAAGWCRVVLGDDLAGLTGKQESGNIGRRLRDGCAAGIVIEQSLKILVHSIFLLI